jgi:hypothetical protein
MNKECLAFPGNTQELVEACVSFCGSNKERMTEQHIRENRARLSGFAEIFHKECGTYLPSVQKRIEDLRNGVGVVLMTAHQPNLFAYSGVFRKVALNFFLAKKLEDRLGVPVVNFFGIADQDFTDDRWVRSCQLPAVQRSGGALSIEIDLPRKLMLNMVAKPPLGLLKKWRAEVEKWLDDAVESVKRLSKATGVSGMCSTPCVSTLEENLVSFWSLIEDCYERSKKYSDFNAFVMSKIVNDLWGYDTVFVRFSECQQALADRFRFLLSRFEDYSELLKRATEIPCGTGVGGGVSDQEHLLVPFWYHCNCGSKVKLFLMEKDEVLVGRGNCVGCQEYYELDFGSKDDPDISGIASRISARAIPMALVFFNGLLPSCYVGGTGGVGYLQDAFYVARNLGIPFPPVAVWRPHDKYLGIGQAEAMLELRRICRDYGAKDLFTAKESLELRLSEIQASLSRLGKIEEKISARLKENPGDRQLEERRRKTSMRRSRMIKSSNLSVIAHELKTIENISAVSGLIPSIIDYLVNVGLKRTSDLWIRHLNEDGNLSSDVDLDSVLGQSVELGVPSVP